MSSRYKVDEASGILPTLKKLRELDLELQENLGGERELEIRFQKSKLLKIIGDPRRALGEILKLEELARDPLLRRRLLAQRLNVSYTLVSLEVPLAEAEVGELEEVLGGLGLDHPNEREPLLSTPEMQLIASSHDPFLSLALLLWRSIIRVEELRERGRDILPALRWQFTVVEALLPFDPAIAWDRYTPLIAQALRVGEVAFASLVWRRAHSFLGRIQRGGAAEYAIKLRGSNHVEWRLHCLLGAAIQLRVGRSHMAAGILRSLSETMPLDAAAYYSTSLKAIYEGMKSRYPSSGAREALAGLSLQSHYTYVGGLL